MMRRAQRGRSHPRGFVLVVVLMLLVVLTLTAAMLLEQSTSNLEVSSGVKAYTIAQARAQLGVQQLRAEAMAAVAAVNALGVCASIELAEQGGCATLPLLNGADPTGFVNFPVSPLTGTDDLTEGAGSQYRAFLVNLGSGVGVVGGARYFIVSTGYYGYVGSLARREARVVVEVTTPAGVVEKTCPSGQPGTC